MQHVLHTAGKRVLTLAEFAARHPALVSTRSERACVNRMYLAVRDNLERWKDTLSAPPSTHVLARQFRHDAEGRLLRATEAGTQAHHSVGALVCQLETPSGLIRVTAEAATLPAAAASTDLQPTIALQCSDSESDDDEVTDAPRLLLARGIKHADRPVTPPQT